MIILRHFIRSISASILLAKKRRNLNFLNIFLILFFYSFSIIRNLNKEKNIFEKKEKFFFKKIDKNNEILKNLSLKGYYDKLILKKNILKKIKKNLILKNLIFASKIKKKNFLQFKKKLKIDDNFKLIQKKGFNHKLSHLGFEVDLKKASFIRNFALSNFFINLAQSYLNTKDITISAQLYISNFVKKIDTHEKKKIAQFFHYDLDFKKFFKVFIYLKKVDKNNGPHSFVEKSHRKKIIKHILMERIDDIQIKKNYGTKNIKVFTGNAGKTIIEDTFGLHKGTGIKKGSREVLILIYGIGRGVGNYKSYIKA